MALPLKNSAKEAPPRLFLIDGTSFCYRGYYAIRSLTTSRGEPTNAIYGFVTMIRKLIQETKPEGLAICFDRKEPTFRHKQYKDYKAHRKPMPEDLAEQLEPIKEFCRAYRYAVYEKPGYEADDLIGTLAQQGEKKGFEVVIVSGDKDAFQLVNGHIKIMNPHRDNEVYDEAAVRKRFDGLGPEKVVEIMALMGDSSDNIPGVPGIGEKTAVKLIREFKTVDNLFKQLPKIRSKPQQTLLKDHEESARMSRQLAVIDTEIPLDICWDDLAIKAPDEPKLIELFRHYEFKNLLKDHMPVSDEEKSSRRYEIIQSGEALKDLIEVLGRRGEFSFDTETTSEDPMKASLVGMSFSWEPFRAAYVPVASADWPDKGLELEHALRALKPLLEDPRLKKYGQNIKYDWIVMKHLGVTLRGIAFDTMIASYLVNPLKLNHNLDDITLEYLQFKKIPTDSLIGKGEKEETMADVPVEKIGPYACEDADCVFRLVPLLAQKMEEHGLTTLFKEVELPLLEVLAKMEMNGVFLDLKFLKKLSEKMGDDLLHLTKEIYRQAGKEFNINSTKQLGEILFLTMGLPVIRRTKTGYSTDESVLQKLAVSYEFPRKILEYRERAKLKSTYLDALPALVHAGTGLIHTSFNQTTTATGRLSSSDPNLQNIPIKTITGREIRKAFIPRPRPEGCGKLIAADYSQIELRILAHLSHDTNLRKAFQENRDIHRFTATLLYGIPENEVTREMRTVAKTINFSIIYGKTAFGLSQDLGLSVSEADLFIEQYFKRYPKIKEYLESQKEKARREGYLTTLLGRRAYFPEIQSKNMQARQFAERAAINAPIQGSAADLIKLAMIHIQRRLEQEHAQAWMTMQVHDELVFDVPEDLSAGVAATVKEEMENAWRLDVPLEADIYVGDSWYKN